MKTEFRFTNKKGNPSFITVAKVVNYAGKKSFVFIETYNTFNKPIHSIELRGASLETFALNILKSVKSKHLITRKSPKQ